MNGIVIRACAKVNLFLDVSAKNTDGYHSVNTVMLSHSLSDRVVISREGNGIKLLCSESRLPVDEKNIAFRAADAFYKITGFNPSVTISLEKNIPFQAGMGGGSTDAAAVIRGLNVIYGNPLDSDSEEKLARTFGADVPFFLRGGCYRLSGRGDIFEEKLNVPKCGLLFIKPDAGISTPDAYKELDRLYRDFSGYVPRDYKKLTAATAGNEFGKICGSIFNIFDMTLPELCPLNIEILNVLRCLTPGAVLSGSGSSVCGFFRTEKAAINAEKKIRKEHPLLHTYVSVPTEKALFTE